jgi:hypothetical protein
MPSSDKDIEAGPKTSSDTDADEQEAIDDSPWEISSNSSDGNQPTQGNRSKTKESHDSAPSEQFSTATNPLILLGQKPTMEMPRILQSIKFTITCLYKLPIRHPAPLDRLKHKTSIDASFYQHFDVLYVKDKFPQLDLDIATRLGKLITRRRQILYYRESHDKSLDTGCVKPKLALPTPPAAKNLSPDISTGGSEEAAGSEVARSRAASSQFTLQSKATTLRLENTPVEEEPGGLYAPSIAESKSSIASSYTGNSLRVEVPPRPKGEDGKELDRFECPYCLVTKMIRSNHTWM